MTEASHTRDTQPTLPGLEARHGLIHVLRPEYFDLKTTDFEDITDDHVYFLQPDFLRKDLLDPSNQGPTTVGFRLADGAWVNLPLTPSEYGLFMRTSGALTKTVLNRVLTLGDKKLQKKTGDETALARTPQDRGTAERGAMRAVMEKYAKMQDYAKSELAQRIKLIKKFSEMTRYPNLNRGPASSIREDIEGLRTKVFADMLDALGMQRGWDNERIALAQRTIQKSLYISADPKTRVTRFGAYLQLAEDYFSYKNALVLTRVAEAAAHIRKNPGVVEDIVATDKARQKV